MRLSFLSAGVVLALAATTATAQTPLTDDDLNHAYNTRGYTMRASVHDPSIVIDNITNPSFPLYYVYGSHLGRGMTSQRSNYQNWSSFGAGEESTGTANSLFADTTGKLVNWRNAYSTHAVKKVKNYKGEEVDFGNFDAHEWQAKGNTVQGMQWAPDIIYNKKMKKWSLYMSLNGDNWCSSIVLFTSASPRGPWVYQGPVVFSGFQGSYEHNGYGAGADWKHTDLAIATGAGSLPLRYNTGSSWGTYWPNCIDPCVFYDDDDNLWMSYGSWSGGIFMLRLDGETGLRDYTHTYPYEINGAAATPGAASSRCTSDPYFGKKIAGGYYVSGEGSYIEKIGSHWFLFMSYGGLNPNAGYQMRVFRADNPEGPYVDTYGTPAVYTSYRMNYGQRANDNRGVLLMDGYQWDTMPAGEVAQGHNSAFTDDKGRSFVVYHTKFNDGTFGHQVRVHQLFLNEDGWLMAAPYEFNGETVTNDSIAQQASVDDADIPGDYQLIRHQYNQPVGSTDGVTTSDYELPATITLGADGSVSGATAALSGKWTRKAGTDFITLTLGGVDYKGALVRQRIDYTNIQALCIAAVSSNSGSLTIGQNSFTRQQEVWASKAPARAAIKYTLDKTSVPVSDGQTMTETVALPTKGYLGATLTWATSDANVVGADGVVGRDGQATLTMTVSKDGYAYTRTYDVTVDKGGKTDSTIYPVSQQKNTSAGWWANFSTQDYALGQGETAHFRFYNYSNREANYKNWCLYGASTTHGGANYEEYFGVRCDNWDNTSASNTGCTSDFDWSTFTADMDGSLVDMNVSYTAEGVFNMTATITTADGAKTYHYSYTKTIAAKPQKLTLFFVSEGSYIDGAPLATNISTIAPNKPQRGDVVIYNLAGQRVGKDYHGIVIINGKKFMNR